MTNAADIIAVLRSGLERIEAMWCEFAAEDDDFNDGYENALADCKEVARDTLKLAYEEGLPQ